MNLSTKYFLDLLKCCYFLLYNKIYYIYIWNFHDNLKKFIIADISSLEFLNCYINIFSIKLIYKKPNIAKMAHYKFGFDQ